LTPPQCLHNDEPTFKNGGNKPKISVPAQELESRNISQMIDRKSMQSCSRAMPI